MWDFSIEKSWTLVLRTYPFLLVRAAVYFGIAAAYVVATGSGSGLGWGIGTLIGPGERVAGAFWGAMAGFAFVSFMLWWLREYILYLVKAGHIVALTLLLDGRAPPAGQGQIGHAIGVVQQRFIEIRVLHSIDRIVRGAIIALIGIIDYATKLLPGRPQALVTPLNMILQVALGFLGEIILAYGVRAAAKNPWQASRDALVLCAQNHGVLIKNATFLAIVAYGTAFIVFLIMLGPAAALANGFPGGSSAVALVLALVFAWSFKQALLEPFMIASLMQVYFRVIEGQRPDPDWDARLTESSRHFRELKAHAAEALRGADSTGF